MSGRLRNVLHGPFCSKQGCRSNLDIISDSDAPSVELTCPLCNNKYSYNGEHEQLRRKALLCYEAKSREAWPVIALDQPPADLQTKDEDESYWLAARIGTKNGKKIGVVYFGEKKSEQGKKDYAQLFLDFDDEQVRHDPSNMTPSDVMSKLTVEFKDTQHIRALKPLQK